MNQHCRGLNLTSSDMYKDARGESNLVCSSLSLVFLGNNCREREGSAEPGGNEGRTRKRNRLSSVLSTTESESCASRGTCLGISFAATSGTERPRDLQNKGVCVCAISLCHYFPREFIVCDIVLGCSASPFFPLLERSAI